MDSRRQASAVDASLSVALKLRAALHGVRVQIGENESADCGDGSMLEGESAGTAILRLPGAISAMLSFDGDDASSPLLVSYRPARLRFGEKQVEAELVRPAFQRLHTRAERPMGQVVGSLGSVLAINPSAACSFSLRGAPCRFCRAGTPLPAAEAFPMSVAEVVESLRAAFDEGLRGPVYFNPSFLGGDDSGLLFLEPYIRAVKRNFPTLVAVQLHPPKSNAWIDRAYAMGVDAMSFGVEIHDANTLQRLCPGRARYMGRERYYEALAYAASIFPRGTVWSDLVLGIEPVESTRRGIQALAGDGVLPVLSMVRHAQLAQLRGVTAARVDEVMTLMGDLYAAVREAKLPLGWVRDLSFAITPFEARALVGQDTAPPGGLERLYGSRWYDLAARNLSRLRRRLRVRQVEDAAHHFDA